MELILASASPRRIELLKQIHPRFRVVPAEVDEEAHTIDDPYATARNLALIKAKHVLKLNPGALVIGGDTVVAYEEDGVWTQLAKPESKEDAIQMLTRLSGRTHSVITGFAFVSGRLEFASHDETLVTFRDLSLAEIVAYVETGESMDKAGGYAIQGGAAEFVASTKGSISNVVGLPIEALSETLDQFGVIEELD